MAGRFGNGGANYLTHASGTVVNCNAAYTKLCFFRRGATGWHTVFAGMCASPSTQMDELAWNGSNQLEMYIETTAGSGTAIATTLTIDTWYGVALVRTATNSCTAKLFTVATGALSTSAADTKDTTVRAAITREHIGNNAYDEYGDCQIAYYRSWSRALSDAELLNEFRRGSAAFRTSLVNCAPIFSGDLASDYGPGGLDWTMTGTVTDVPPPPVTFAGAISVPMGVAAGAGTQDMAPGFISAGSSLFNPTLTPGAVNIAPGTIASGSSLSAPALTLTIALDTIAAESALFAPTLVPGAVTIEPGTIAAGSSLFGPALTLAILPGTIASGSSVFAPSLTVGPANISPDAIASGSALFAPTLTPGVVDMAPGTIAAGSALFGPSLVLTIAPGTIAAGSALFGPTIGGLTISPGTIAAGTTLFAPSLSLGSLGIFPDAIASATTLYGPTLATTSLVLKSATIPAGALGATSMVLGFAMVRRTAGADSCTLRVTYGGQVVVQFAVSAAATIELRWSISRPSVGNQRGYGRLNTEAEVTGTTTADETEVQPMQLVIDKTTGGDSFTCDQFAVQVAA